MELRHVEYFLAAVDHDGLGSAAAALGVSKPSLSSGLRSLEKDLGADLFHRVGRGMVLSAAGKAFVGPARQIVRDTVAAESAYVAPDGLPRGRLDICASAYVAEGPVAGVIGRFRKRYPSVSVRLAGVRPADPVGALIRDGHCEIVFSHLPVAAPGLTVRSVGQHEYWVAFPPGTDVPDDDPFPLGLLPDIRVVGVPKEASSRSVVERALQAAGSHTVMSTVLEQREAVGSFVVEGVGMSFIERSLARRAGAAGAVVRRPDPPITLGYGVVYDPRRLSPAAAAFLDML
ncbi:LysR family transcriptional regulator [Rhodococcus triatomae]|uniref:DNA-binding transcriptional regulator, LysR family n=1 Tax=Rhodococcus triatomae TaxID=300028 RepID=A0A1G8GEY9_9NOCA|nr:LysR family transcriptional regulator [Rhodococcus triatomae]QNG20399.1 LysR family transcriptional regulator [Rhodococcus triatomae]QNG23685.1 LysR family transcriptional regulator [Rhodococcus triatomae]SDH92890.1 DNA-binding transcriptional regulator, LysR family [Rhodococcus triatomae]